MFSLWDVFPLPCGGAGVSRRLHKGDTGAWDTAPSLARAALQIPDARPVAPRDSAHPRVTRSEWLSRLGRDTRSAMCTPPRRPPRADRPTRACDASRVGSARAPVFSFLPPPTRDAVRLVGQAGSS